MKLIGNGDLAKQIEDVIGSINTYSISQRGKIKIDSNAASFLIAFAGLDDIGKRQKEFELACLKGVPGILISPKAVVSQEATIFGGTVILHNGFIGPGTILYDNVLVGTGAIIEHDSSIGAHSVVLTGAIINGGCKIGERCMIGSGAIVSDHISICDDVTIGAGAVVVKDITVPGRYVGCPAKPIL